MTKAEILHNLVTSNKLNHFNTENGDWQNAFLLYNAVHGLSGKEALRMNCDKCFLEVKEWLQR